MASYRFIAGDLRVQPFPIILSLAGMVGGAWWIARRHSNGFRRV